MALTRNQPSCRCLLSTPRTELHLNHLAENNVFGIVPLAKVRASLWGLSWWLWG